MAKLICCLLKFIPLLRTKTHLNDEFTESLSHQTLQYVVIRDTILQTTKLYFLWAEIYSLQAFITYKTRLNDRYRIYRKVVYSNITVCCYIRYNIARSLTFICCKGKAFMETSWWWHLIYFCFMDTFFWISRLKNSWVTIYRMNKLIPLFSAIFGTAEPKTMLFNKIQGRLEPNWPTSVSELVIPYPPLPLKVRRILYVKNI